MGQSRPFAMLFSMQKKGGPTYALGAGLLCLAPMSNTTREQDGQATFGQYSKKMYLTEQIKVFFLPALKSSAAAAKDISATSLMMDLNQPANGTA